MPAMSLSISFGRKSGASTISRSSGRRTLRASWRRCKGAMRIQVSAIGRLKSGLEREIASDYVNRAAASGRTLGIASIAIVEHAESSAASERLRREEEGSRLLSAVPGGASVVALDEGGRHLNSSEFAQMVK